MALLSRRLNLRIRTRNKYRDLMSATLNRRRLERTSQTPFISFSFDDFPASAMVNAARVLADYNVHATYFVATGLLGAVRQEGRIASIPDLVDLVRTGHEIGGHTFDHLDSWSTASAEFENSVAKNQARLRKLLPEAECEVFSYPLTDPNPKTKRLVGRHFMCCRGGGQRLNGRVLDLNLLSAYFLDWRNRDDLSEAEYMIDRNTSEGGWLIFATHDVVSRPSRYGCTVQQFAHVVDYAVRSGGVVQPIGAVCRRLVAEQA